MAEGCKEQLCQVMGKASFSPVSRVGISDSEDERQEEVLNTCVPPTLRDAAQTSTDDKPPDGMSFPAAESACVLPGASPVDASTKCSSPQSASVGETLRRLEVSGSSLLPSPTAQSRPSSAGTSLMVPTMKQSPRSDIQQKSISESSFSALSNGVHLRDLHVPSGSSLQGVWPPHMQLGHASLATMHTWLEHAAVEQDKALKGQPAIAVLHEVIPRSCAVDHGIEDEAKRDDLREFLADVHVCAQASVNYFGASRQLSILRLNPPRDDLGTPLQGVSCIQQLLQLKQEAETALGSFRADDGPWMWPLHEKPVCKALQAWEEEMVLGLNRDSKRMHCWQRLLYELRIYSPENGGPFIDVLQDTVGPGVAFCFAWSHFYTQQLWILAALTMVWLLFCVIFSESPEEAGIESKDTGNWDLVAHPQRRARAVWEVGKIAVIVWGVVVVCPWRKLILVVRRKGRKDRKLKVQRTSNPYFQKEAKSWSSRLCLFICGVIPIIALFIALVHLTLLSVTMLLVYLTYDWGDCLNLGCKDPQAKHGFWGWLAEVSVDILLAILFELFFAIAKAVAEIVAQLRNYRYRKDYLFTKDILTVALAAIERVGVFGVVALVFVPEWSRSDQLKDEINCSDLFFLTRHLFCFSRRLSVEQRRNVFEQSMKGPFVVAPLVGIIVKVLVPLLVEKLDQMSRSCRAVATSFWEVQVRSIQISIGLRPMHSNPQEAHVRIGQRKLRGARFVLWLFVQPLVLAVNVVTRIFALILVYECDAVGCFRLVFFGWPFTDLKVMESTDTHQAMRSSEVMEGATGPLLKADGRETETIHIPQYSLGTSSSSLDLPGLHTYASNEMTAGWKHFGASLPRSSREHILHGAILQGVRKPFEPLDELIEMKMNFIWILFFLPVFPIGIFPMLISRILEVKFDLTKMLFIRRRIFPDDDSLERMTQTAFMRAVVVASVGWNMALSLITYNDFFWKSPTGQRFFCGGVACWLVLSVFVALSYNAHAVSWCGIAMLFVIIFVGIAVVKFVTMGL